MATVNKLLVTAIASRLVMATKELPHPRGSIILVVYDTSSTCHDVKRITRNESLDDEKMKALAEAFCKTNKLTYRNFGFSHY